MQYTRVTGEGELENADNSEKKGKERRRECGKRVKVAEGMWVPSTMLYDKRISALRTSFFSPRFAWRHAAPESSFWARAEAHTKARVARES